MARGQPPVAGGDGGRPVRVHRARPGWARRWTRDDVRRRAGSCPAGRPSAAAATPARSRRSSTSRSWPRPRVPRTTNVQGLGIVAPSIFDYGTDDQIRDYAMPILRGEVTACLGMSEPGAGQRPGLAVHPGGARRRPLGDQRAEGVDLGRQLRRLLLPVLPHRPRRAEAQGHLDRARADGHAGHHRAAAARDRAPRAPRPERGVPRRRHRAGGEPRRRR